MDANKNTFSEMTDDELLVEKKKLKKSKILHASIIGFLAGILFFGFGGWILNPERKFGFFLPMLFPMIAIYRLLKKSKSNQDLEEALKQRGLN